MGKNNCCPQSPERVVLFQILMWVRSVCLFVCLSFGPSTVVRYYMKYTGLSLGPSPPAHCPRSQSSLVGIGAFLKKKEV